MNTWRVDWTVMTGKTFTNTFTSFEEMDAWMLNCLPDTLPVLDQIAIYKDDVLRSLWVR